MKQRKGVERTRGRNEVLILNEDAQEEGSEKVGFEKNLKKMEMLQKFKTDGGCLGLAAGQVLRSAQVLLSRGSRT